jgi:hypothetical protein
MLSQGLRWRGVPRFAWIRSRAVASMKVPTLLAIWLDRNILREVYSWYAPNLSERPCGAQPHADR